MGNVTKLRAAPSGTATALGDTSIVRQVMMKGDLGRLSAEERARYYEAVCASVGLNPLTQPFEYITLDGKLTLYAKKNCAEQLRQIHGVSTEIKSRETADGVHTVHVAATTRDGRTDEDIGSVSLVHPLVLAGQPNPRAGQPLTGLDLANALMHAITKAKRRATLSVCGLGMLDETEIADIGAARTKPPAARVTPLSAAESAPSVFDCDLSPDGDAVDPTPPEDVPAVQIAAEAAPVVPAAPSLPAALARLGANVMAAAAVSAAAEPEPQAPALPAIPEGEVRMTPGELTAKIVGTLLKLSRGDAVDGTLAVFKARPGWDELDPAQIATIDLTAEAVRQRGKSRRRPAAKAS